MDETQGTPPRSAIIADRHALGRNLVRFLLEEEGFSILAEAATMAEVLLAVQDQQPDTIVVHENMVSDHDPATLAQIRQLSPHTNVVLMIERREKVPIEFLAAADAVVEEGPGLGQLAFAAVGPAPTAAERTAAEKLERARRGVRVRRRWGERLEGAVAASVLVLAVILVRTGVIGPPTTQPPPAAQPSVSPEPGGSGSAITTPAPNHAPDEVRQTDAEAPASGTGGGASTEPEGEPRPSPAPSETPPPEPTETPPPEPTETPPPEPSETPPPEPSETPPPPEPSETPPPEPTEAPPPDDGTSPVDEVADPVIEVVEQVVADGLEALAPD